MHRNRFYQSITGWALIASGFVVPAAMAQLDESALESLQMEAQTENWSFTVGRNPATYRSLDTLCELQAPEDWQAGARVNPLMQAPSGLVVLPASFDWREQGMCTPVRNQGGCGSCWAFATVGVMESAILIDSGVSQDLSEQYLVNCNRSNYSCNGGWWAHSYHHNTAGLSGGIGAVLESAKPYIAKNVACGGPFVHPYVLNDWYYVDGSVAIPSTDAIKQAIYTYGPVSVAVYVNYAFQAYTSGVFNGCAAGTINHAVVLVGWNDEDQAWIMRNSWGPNWGESGYMRIAYGCSKIGYGACYVDYGTGEAEGAVITSPANGSTLTDQSATFEWTPDERASEYWLGIGDGAGKFNFYSASQGTNTSVTVERLPASGRALYAKLFSKIDGTWSGKLYTYTSVNIPAATAAMTSPEPGSTLDSSTATFEWTPGARVADYRLWIGTTRGTYNLYNVAAGKALTATVSNLPAGGRTLYVRLFSKIANVWQSADYTYTAATSDPAAAVMTSPENSSTLESSTVTFTWSEGLGVSEYILQIGTSLAGQNLYKKSLAKQRAATVAGLPSNGSTLYVRLHSKCAGVWQHNDYQYTTSNQSRSAAEMTSPVGGTTFSSNVVTFAWSAGVGATQYRLDVGTALNQANLYNQVQGLKRTVTLSNMPMNGRTVYVRLWSMIGGVWQKRNYTYTAATGTPTAAAMISPAGGSTLSSTLVTFSWSEGTGVAEYWLKVGTTFGGTQLYNKSQGLNNTATLANLPANGKLLYVRLASKVAGTWRNRDYTYRAAPVGTARPVMESR